MSTSNIFNLASLITKTHSDLLQNTFEDIKVMFTIKGKRTTFYGCAEIISNLKSCDLSISHEFDLRFDLVNLFNRKSSWPHSSD